ncbi:MAG: hypothetical protein DI534_11800 [Leifsonia xyli]|nr:MAG: hypothetical protein DI534_11800 [Leifsonia xyli]
MRRWQRIRVLILQSVNAAFGAALIWIGASSSLPPVVIVGAVLIVIAAALVIATLRVPVTNPKPPRDGAPRERPGPGVSQKQDESAS